MSYPADVRQRLAQESAQIIARYPKPRSALLPMLHLVQAEDGYVSPDGIVFCAEMLDLQAAEVSAVATFYTQYKRRPNGTYTVGVCTNTLCAVMGGDEIYEAVSEHLGVGNDETTDDGAITLEKIECNAACDYAPVVMVNWEFFDNQTPASTIALCDELRSGAPVAPTRGAAKVCSFRETSRVLAGFPDGRADEGLGAGGPSLAGVRLARDNDWAAPSPAPRADRGAQEAEDSAPSTGAPGSSAQHQSGSGAAATDNASGGSGPSRPAATGGEGRPADEDTSSGDTKQGDTQRTETQGTENQNRTDTRNNATESGEKEGGR